MYIYYYCLILALPYPVTLEAIVTKSQIMLFVKTLHVDLRDSKIAKNTEISGSVRQHRGMVLQ